VEGEHYLFLSPEEFERKVQRNEFLEHASVHGNRYGTLRSEVEARLQEGLHVILEIDVQGALQVKDAMPDAVLVFILAPSMEDLRKRLEARGSEDEEEVLKRLRTAEREVRLVDTYDYVIINDDAARATEELADVIRSLSREED
jgi:guanylate kinase